MEKLIGFLILTIIYCFFIIIKLSKVSEVRYRSLKELIDSYINNNDFISNQELARYLFNENDLVNRTIEAKEIKMIMNKKGYKKVRINKDGKRYGGYLK